MSDYIFKDHFDKADKIILSCNNKKQYKVALNYCNLLFKKIDRTSIFPLSSIQIVCYRTGQMYGLIEGMLSALKKK